MALLFKTFFVGHDIQSSKLQNIKISKIENNIVIVMTSFHTTEDLKH
jgi:hypothetical protein